MRIDTAIPASKLTEGQQINRDDAKLRKACREFEALLVSQMLTKMRNSVPKTDLFGSQEKEAIFRDMLDQEIAKEISATDSMGIADLLYRQLSSQEKSG